MAGSATSLHVNTATQQKVDYQSPYARHVLRLAETQTEDAWEDELRARAEGLGVNVDDLAAQKPYLAPTNSSHPSRRSMSVYSITSQSTGMTSTLSETSSKPHSSRPQRKSRANLSLRDYDIFLARGTPDERRTSISFSQPSTPADSALSLPLCSPLPSPRRQSRVLKSLGILKLNRQDQAWRTSDGCPHCPRNSTSQRRAVHRLPCGHRVCTSALRSTISMALSSKTGAIPSCCGIPIPGALAQNVMTPEEQEALLNKLAQWDEVISLASSTPSEAPAPPLQDSTPSLGPTGGASARKSSNESKESSFREEMDAELDAIRDRMDFKRLQEEQTKLRDLFLTWARTQRTELLASHERLRREMKEQHESDEEHIIESHERAIEEAEDQQVKAEADLRTLHAQEKRDNATALKHMEAYCDGKYSTGEAHNRLVTDQDRAELAKTKKIRQQMAAKHQSAINVLRGDQARRINLRQQRRDRQLQELHRAQRMEELSGERAWAAELRQFDDFLMDKQQRISMRWLIQNVVFAKTVEIETGAAVSRNIPTLQWPAGDLAT